MSRGSSALAELLQTAGLLNGGLAAQAARLAEGFPATTQRNMFLEYELALQPVPAGYGLGFQPGVLDYFVATDHGFLKTPAGRAIQIARAENPFTPDLAVDLSYGSDSDPDWIEYDIDGGRIDLTPFVFFRFPSRLQTISTSRQARTLCSMLPGRARTGEFAALLDRLLRLGPVAMYRVGVARRRGKDWWRAILSCLTEDQVTLALTGIGAQDLARPLEIARAFYAGQNHTPGACFALSIDVREDNVSGIDVECPYFFRIDDLSKREAALGILLQQSSEAGIISARVADWLAAYACRDVLAEDSQHPLRVMLHHLKYRALGSPHRRTKAYLHLKLTDDRDEKAAP
jgi:hypothetical protein